MPSHDNTAPSLVVLTFSAAAWCQTIDINDMESWRFGLNLPNVLGMEEDKIYYYQLKYLLQLDKGQFHVKVYISISQFFKWFLMKI